MGTDTMGRTVVKAKIENLAEQFYAEKGIIRTEEIHRIAVDDALVDAGSTYLSMPKSKLKELGFKKAYGTAHMRTANVPGRVKLYGPVKLTVQGRYCRVDVAEIAEGNPVLIGQVPLELMDFVVDPKRGKLIGNPAHGGQWIIDMF